MDERDADIFVDPAARCRRLARNIADDAAKRKLTGGGIRDDGGLAEGRKENRRSRKRRARQPLRHTRDGLRRPSLRTQRSVYRREYRALQSIGLRV
jgi:hypothetical protein